MTTFVLIHGSWHDGSLWKPVVEHLRDKGHIAWAPTVAGHGKGAARNVTHDDCTKSIVDFIKGHNLRDIVLLGHSYGGTIIARAVQFLPERVKRLVFWNAFVVQDGESLNDNVPPHYRETFAALAAQSPDRSVVMPFPIWRESFVNDVDLGTAKATYEMLSPEPYQPFVDKLDMKKFYELVHGGKIACSYINCTEDTALPQGDAWGWHPRMSSRLGLFRLVQMPGSHEAMLTNPIALAEKIIEAGRD